MEPTRPTRAAAAFERRVRRALGDAGVASDEPLVVACSGGADSSATLLAVARTHAQPRLVTAAYFDHGWRVRAETAADCAAVSALAQRAGARSVDGLAEPGATRGEAAARRARYGWLAAACRAAGARVCVTGHTQDDQAETVILRLTRGSGLSGVAGMAPLSRWPVSGGGGLRVARPLLGEPRDAVNAYLDAMGETARHDASNELLDLARNRVRRRVIPELRALNPRASQAIAAFADRARADAATLDALAAERAQGRVRVEGGGVHVQRAWLRAQPRAIAARVVLQAAAAVGLTISGAQLEAVLRAAPRRGATVQLRGGRVRMHADAAVIERHAGLPDTAPADAPADD